MACYQCLTADLGLSPRRNVLQLPRTGTHCRYAVPTIIQNATRRADRPGWPATPESQSLPARSAPAPSRRQSMRAHPFAATPNSQREGRDGNDSEDAALPQHPEGISKVVSHRSILSRCRRRSVTCLGDWRPVGSSIESVRTKKVGSSIARLGRYRISICLSGRIADPLTVSWLRFSSAWRPQRWRAESVCPPLGELARPSALPGRLTCCSTG
jgi:hypothetical protein